VRVAVRPQERRSVRGKQASLTFAETSRNVRPLVSQIRGARVPLDLFAHIVKIFKHIDERTYVLATDAYILAAIGNAAWPIGAHARASGASCASRLASISCAPRGLDSLADGVPDGLAD
jgi:hypothetical protein